MYTLGEINEFPQTKTVPPPTVQQSGPPPTLTWCNTLYEQFLSANPQYRACLNGSDREYLVSLCVMAAEQKVPQDQANAAVLARIAQKCPPPVTQQPPTPPPPAQVPTNPPTPPAQVPPPVMVPNTPGDTTDHSPKTFLRQVGPVVGIGLLVAIGFTAARKRALTKHKRRR